MDACSLRLVLKFFVLTGGARRKLVPIEATSVPACEFVQAVVGRELIGSAVSTAVPRG